MQEIYNISAKCADLFLYENLNIENFSMSRMMERLRLFQSEEMLKLNESESEFTVVETEDNHTLIELFAFAVVQFLDTYMVVLLVIERLCGT